MNFFEAILMAIIQGITEFLPVSSSGHLALFKIIFNLQEAGILYDVLLHVGTLIAIFIVYRKDIWELIKEAVFLLGDILYNLGRWLSNVVRREKGGYKKVISSTYRRFVIMIIVSCIPTAVIGLVGKDFVELSGQTLLIPGICLVVTAILLSIADYVKPGKLTAANAGWGSSVIIGVAQGIATMPGLSRSGTTIAACLLLGYEKSFAVKYSFILSIPAVLGSLLLEIKDIAGADFSGSEIASYIVGMIIAAAVGFFCIKFLIYLIKNKRFMGFSIYCAVIGMASIIIYFVTR